MFDGRVDDETVAIHEGESGFMTAVRLRVAHRLEGEVAIRQFDGDVGFQVGLIGLVHKLDVGFAGELLAVNKANLEAASSRIVDVDVAAESTQLARWNTLVQAGTAMLAQANQSSQAVLRLLQQ